MNIKTLMLLLFLTNSFLRASSTEDNTCASCKEWIFNKDSRYFTCNKHFSCQECLEEHIKQAINNKVMPSCISCEKNIETDIIDDEFHDLFKVLINSIDLEEYSQTLPPEKNSYCKSCKKWIFNNDSRYFGCDEHFSCRKCLNKHIKNSIKNKTWPDCISCDESLDGDFIAEEFPYFFSKKNRFCRSCKEWIPKEDSRYYCCKKHFGCERCLKKHIKSSLKQHEWPSCISCEIFIDEQIIKEKFPKLHEGLSEALKETHSCTVCFDLVNPDLRSYHCDEHWSCEPCFKSYIKEWVNEGKIPIKCFDQNCENLIKLIYIQRKYPEQYQRMIEWVDEHTPKNIQKQIEENKKLLTNLMEQKIGTYTQCPNCGYVIERISGCDQMFCRACRKSFHFVIGRNHSNLIHKIYLPLKNKTKSENI